jgi:hypothetical protein
LHSDIVQACALHHDPRHSESRPVRVAMISDLLSDLAVLTPAEREGHDALAKLAKLGLTRPKVDNVLRRVQPNR